MTRPLSIALLVLTVGSVQAEIYKCTDPATGKVTISQFQCAPEAAPVAVDVIRPTEAQQQITKQRMDWIVNDTDARYQRTLQARVEAQQQARIDALQRARDATVERNALRATFAANNLAGATYQQAQATETQAEVNRLNADIDAERRRMEKLRGE